MSIINPTKNQGCQKAISSKPDTPAPVIQRVRHHATGTRNPIKLKPANKRRSAASPERP